jgi:hypothetical protein
MNAVQQAAFAAAVEQARVALAQGDLAAAQAQLERAHVLGQAEVLPHGLTHWLMLRVAWRRRQRRAVLGQALRIVLGALGSAVGRVPTGNTGGSDIGMFRRLPVPPELQRLIEGRAPDSRAGKGQ